MTETVIKELLVKFNGDTSGIEKASDRALTALKALVSIEVGRRIVDTALKTAEWADNLLDLSQTLGMATEKLQGLQYAAIANGSSINELNSGIQFFTRVVGDAALNGGAFADAMAASGMVLRDSNGELLSTSQLLPQVADMIQNAATAQEKLSIATDFFGRSAAPSMVRMLSQGSAGLHALEQNAISAGAVLDSEMIEKAAEINGQWELLTHTIGINFKGAVISAMQSVTDLVASFGDLDVSGIGGDLTNQINELSKIRDELVNESSWSGASSIFDVVNKPSQNAKIEELNAMIGALQQRRQVLGNIVPNTQRTTQNSGMRYTGVADIKDSAEAKEAAIEYEKMNNALKYQIELMADIKDSAKDTFSSFAKSVAQGTNALDALRNTALNVIGQIADSMMSLAFGGSSGGGIGGVIAGALTNMLGATVTAISGPMAGQQVVPSIDPKPMTWGPVSSFAVGTNEVPKDMLANIHKGEMIIPAFDAKKIRSGGGVGGVTQNITINAGVSQTVRAEILKMLPTIKGVAVSGVSDVNKRTLAGV
jgi:hypothetical protein